MSDGNFNTQLLTPGGFASGVRAGEARMKQKALKAVACVLHGTEGISQETAETIVPDSYPDIVKISEHGKQSS